MDRASGTGTQCPANPVHISWGAEMAEKVLTREEVLSQLRKHKPELEKQFGVAKLLLYGSVARDEATADSDINLMVSFDGPTTSERFFGVQFYVEDLLERPVDLVTERAQRKAGRPHIGASAVYV